MNEDDSSKSLVQLGYNPLAEAGRLELGANTDNLARVTAEHKGEYEVMGINGTTFTVSVPRGM